MVMKSLKQKKEAPKLKKKKDLTKEPLKEKSVSRKSGIDWRRIDLDDQSTWPPLDEDGMVLLCTSDDELGSMKKYRFVKYLGHSKHLKQLNKLTEEDLVYSFWAPINLPGE